MKVKNILLAGTALLVLAGCSNPPHHGLVLDRDYSPGHYNYWTSSDCYSYRKDGSCSVTVVTHHQYWVDPAWSLELKADASDTKHDKTGWITVSQDGYVAHPPGSSYP